MLHVADVRRSLAFDRERLGFTLLSPEPLVESDVVGLHRELAGRGVNVGSLCVTAYRMKEFSCLDPDGHMLTFGLETDAPPTPDEDEGRAPGGRTTTRRRSPGASPSRARASSRAPRAAPTRGARPGS
jgi:hypothetical protein